MADKWDAIKEMWSRYPVERSLADFCREHNVPYSTASKRLRASDRDGDAGLTATAETIISDCLRSLRGTDLNAAQKLSAIDKLTRILDRRDDVDEVERRVKIETVRAIVAGLDGLLCRKCEKALRAKFRDG